MTAEIRNLCASNNVLRDEVNSLKDAQSPSAPKVAWLETMVRQYETVRYSQFS